MPNSRMNLEENGTKYEGECFLLNKESKQSL